MSGSCILYASSSPKFKCVNSWLKRGCGGWCHLNILFITLTVWFVGRKWVGTVRLLGQCYNSYESISSGFEPVLLLAINYRTKSPKSPVEVPVHVGILHRQ